MITVDQPRLMIFLFFSRFVFESCDAFVHTAHVLESNKFSFGLRMFLKLHLTFFFFFSFCSQRIKVVGHNTIYPALIN